MPIFQSPLTGRYYYASRVKDLGRGRFKVIGKKVDVTEDILFSDLIRMATEATALPKFSTERIAPSRLAAMTDFNDALALVLRDTKAGGRR